MKNFRLNVVFILIVFIVGLLPFSPFVTNVYGVASLSREIIISILCFLLCINTPYEQIASKCILIGFTLIQFSNLFLAIIFFFYMIEFENFYVVLLFSLISITSVFFAIQLTNKYKYSSEIIEQEYIYYLCPKADDLNGLLSSIFYYPFSGVKVLCNNSVYCYKNGQLKKFTGRKALFYISKCLAFNTKVKFTKEIENELDSLVGVKWSYNNNCYKTFEPLFGPLKSKMR